MQKTYKCTCRAQKPYNQKYFDAIIVPIWYKALSKSLHIYISTEVIHTRKRENDGTKLS